MKYGLLMKIICDTQALVFWMDKPEKLGQTAEFSHGDPADRIIAATAIAHNAALITADAKLQKIARLNCIW